MVSMWCSAAALLVCVITAFTGPGYTTRLSGADHSTTISSEHCILSLSLVAAVYLSFIELKQIRLNSIQTKYEPVDSTEEKTVRKSSKVFQVPRKSDA